MGIIESSDANFKSLLAENEKVVVKYFASWCGACRLFTPKYKRIASDEKHKDVTFLDVNAEESPEARKLGNVSNLPFFAVFKNGELLASKATSKEEALLEMIHTLEN